MRKAVYYIAGGVALSLIACLVMPDEPSGTTKSASTCASDERLFNGVCRKVCSANADCTSSNASCMKVSDDVSVCLDYKHCAYLGSDTTCSGGAFEYDAYSSYPYSYGSSYGYGGPGSCQGNATWEVIAPSGDPQCGVTHAVTRCTSVGNTCALVSGATTDIAEP